MRVHVCVCAFAIFFDSFGKAIGTMLVSGRPIICSALCVPEYALHGVCVCGCIFVCVCACVCVYV